MFLDNGQKNATICLNMIVKNESHIIEKTLQNLCDKMQFSYWVISDTGSTDDTPMIITEFFKKKNIPGELNHDEWKNFAHNRTLALDQAYNKTDLLLVFDADDELHGDFVAPTEVKYDQYHLKFGDPNGTNYTRVLMINNRKKFKYLSVIHEFISCCEPNCRDTIIDGNYYVVSGRSGSRNKNPNKYLDDAKVLEAAHKEALLENDPLHLRYAFYCGNSYKDCGRYEDAIKWYKTTLAQNNWGQEKYMSCFYMYECYGKLDQQQNAFYYLVEAFKYDDQRVECLHPLLVHYCCNGMYNVAYNYYRIVKNFYENKYINTTLNDKLFLDVGKYNFHVPYYMILIADKVQEYQTVIRMYEIIFAKKYRMFETWWVKNLLYNMQFFFTHTSDPEFVRNANEYFRYLHENKVPLSSFSFLRDYHKYGINLDYVFPPKITERVTIFNEEQCKSCKNILIYTGFSEEDWNYSYMIEKALGGSEKAAAYIAREFSKDYTIYITGGVKDAVYDNVRYVHTYKVNDLIDKTPFHTVIISRYISFLEMFSSISTYQIYLWAHDTHFLPYGCNLTGEQIVSKWEKYITGCICLTEWQKNNYINAYPELKDKITLINNGLDISKFCKSVDIKVKNRFIYTSCSERGLKTVIKLWPAILAKMPDASLVISSYNKFPKNDDEKEIKKNISNYPSITHMGKLGVADLYHEMMHAEYWLYPCVFPETSCITALEMLMNEVICLYYPCAALPDTMQDYGIQIREGNELEKLFAITDEQKAVMRKRGRQYAESCSWTKRCRQWESLLFKDQMNTSIKDVEQIEPEVVKVEPEVVKVEPVVVKVEPVITKVTKPVKDPESDEWIFFAPNWYKENILDDYFDALKSKYNVTYTKDKDYVLNSKSKKVSFVMYFLDTDVIEELMKRGVEISLFNTEPLTISKRINDLINTVKRCPHPNPKIYDYSKSNIKILNTYGLDFTEYLPYEITDKENTYLSTLYKDTAKLYDFGLISADNPCSCIRRQDVVDFLNKNGFTVKLISGFKNARDEELAKCKIILNIHGKYLDEPSNVFEHIRCDRLLNAGFKVLSEENYKLDPGFITRFPNMKIIEYNDFLDKNIYNDPWFGFQEKESNTNLCKRKIIDCFIFYNELDLLKYRLNVLKDVVDYFVLVEATLSHVGNEKPLYYDQNKEYFKEFADKIIHVIVDDFPFNSSNINIKNNDQWKNEHHQRNCISRGVSRLDVNDQDLFIVADLDEIPDPKVLNKLKITQDKIQAYRFEQDFYYYNLNSKRQEKWYHSKIISHEYKKHINISFQDIRFLGCPNLPKGGWHLSYFGSPDFIKNKLENFTHQEYNNKEIINIDHIKKQITTCDDLFNRPGQNKMHKIDIEDNNYLPPMYETYLRPYYVTNQRSYRDTEMTTKYLDMPRIDTSSKKTDGKNYCFIHSSTPETGDTYRLDHLICRLKETKCIDIFENIIINNVGTPIDNNYDDKKIILINDPESINLFEMTTLNKLRDFSSNNSDMRILYLHTKGVSYSKNFKAVNDWIDQMLYFLVEKHPICTEVLSRGFDTVGCNYLRDYRRSIPVHYSGNFWWASSKYLATLPKMHESTTNKADTEFWLCKNNPIMYIMDTSNVDQYIYKYPREKYADEE
jgi:beta-1,4-mannosyl-glycoprotein beta-1,4-N-acetylglucosaminyltransferase